MIVSTKVNGEVITNFEFLKFVLNKCILASNFGPASLAWNYFPEIFRR